MNTISAAYGMQSSRKILAPCHPLSLASASKHYEIQPGGVRLTKLTSASADPFDEFVNARYQAMLRVAYLITADVHDAADLLQDALAQVYGRRKLIEDPAATEAYVRRALLRTHVSRWRRTRREVLLDSLPEMATPSSTESEREVRLDLALRDLPPKQRAVVVLRFYLDLPMNQVAEELGCSLATSKTHLTRAMRTLRRVLMEKEETRIGS